MTHETDERRGRTAFDITSQESSINTATSIISTATLTASQPSSGNCTLFPLLSLHVSRTLIPQIIQTIQMQCRSCLVLAERTSITFLWFYNPSYGIYHVLLQTEATAPAFKTNKNPLSLSEKCRCVYRNHWKQPSLNQRILLNHLVPVNIYIRRLGVFQSYRLRFKRITRGICKLLNTQVLLSQNSNLMEHSGNTTQLFQIYTIIGMLSFLDLDHLR